MLIVTFYQQNERKTKTMIQSNRKTASDLFGAVNVFAHMIQCGFKPEIRSPHWIDDRFEVLQTLSRCKPKTT